MKGRVLNLQRMSTEDGPGIRTTVFLKGCPLKCAWCHNPESMSPRPEVIVHPDRCLACDACLAACPHGCNASACEVCGRCVDVCPSGAREMQGTDWDVDALFSEVAKDRAYFEASGGGVTVSGGEPTMQAAFAEAFLTRCRNEGIHTALDTCGACGTDVLLRLAGQVELVLFDVKEIDPGLHRMFTGVDNDRILANLDALAHRTDTGIAPPVMWVRTPLIPGATATMNNVVGIGRHLAKHLGTRLARWELCAFNNLCREQYKRLGRTWEFADEPLMRREDVNLLLAAARESGVDPDIVHATGATRRDETRGNLGALEADHERHGQAG